MRQERGANFHPFLSGLKGGQRYGFPTHTAVCKSVKPGMFTSRHNLCCISTVEIGNFVQPLEMITLLVGTNRKNNKTALFAADYLQILEELGESDVKLLDLSKSPHDWFHPDMYDHPSDSLKALQDEYILAAQQFIILAPEYNGSIPGILKLFFDACSVREYEASFKGKAVLLTGIASGRAGNLRGMDHLTAILQHLGMHVFPDKLPISSIDKLRDETGKLTHQETRQAIIRQLKAFFRKNKPKKVSQETAS